MSNLFEDIIEYMEIESELTKYATVERSKLKELYGDNVRVAAFHSPQKPPYIEQASTSHRVSEVASPQYSSPSSAPQAVSEPVHVQYAEPVSAPAPDLSSVSFEELQAHVANCVRCGLCRARRNTVFGEGNPNADLMFIGEGPDRDEDQQGRPFVGEAGQLLTKMINAMQFSREEVFLTNIVKCRAPGNRDPETSEAAACLPYLRRQIELVRPRIIVLLGAVPVLRLLNMKGITNLRGQWFEYMGIRMLPTFHPAYLLRNSDAKKEVWADLQMVMREFGKIPPGKSRNT